MPEPKKDKPKKTTLTARYQAAYDQLRHLRLEMGRVRHRLLSIEGVSTTHPAFLEQVSAASKEIQDAEAKAEALLEEMKKGGAQ